MATERKSRWGIGIAALYIGFVLFILACVGFASLQDFDLVEDDYYARGLAYETQLDKLRRTADLSDGPAITLAGTPAAIAVTFPDTFAPDSVGGTVTLYCPANSRADRTLPLALDSDRTMRIETNDLTKGAWKVKLDWQYGGASYYTEDLLILQ